MTQGIEPWATPQPSKHFLSQLAGKIGPTIADHDFWYTYMGEQINQHITDSLSSQ